MTADEILRQLSAALADVEPSADFGARVRARIDAAPRRTVAGVAWRHVFLGGVATGLATALVVMLSSRSVSQRTVIATPTSVSRHETAPTAPTTGAAQLVATTSREHAREADSSIVSREAGHFEAAVSLEPTVTRVDGHDVIVPADQRLALARLLDGVNEGRVRVPRSLVPIYDHDGLLLSPPPIVITLLSVSAADADDAGTPGIRQPPTKDKR